MAECLRRSHVVATMTVFSSGGEIPIDNNVSEREMKRIVLNRKNSLFVAKPRGRRTQLPQTLPCLPNSQLADCSCLQCAGALLTT